MLRSIVLCACITSHVVAQGLSEFGIALAESFTRFGSTSSLAVHALRAPEDLDLSSRIARVAELAKLDLSIVSEGSERLIEIMKDAKVIQRAQLLGIFLSLNPMLSLNSLASLLADLRSLPNPTTDKETCLSDRFEHALSYLFASLSSDQSFNPLSIDTCLQASKAFRRLFGREVLSLRPARPVFLGAASNGRIRSVADDGAETLSTSTFRSGQIQSSPASSVASRPLVQAIESWFKLDWSAYMEAEIGSETIFGSVGSFLFGIAVQPFDETKSTFEILPFIRLYEEIRRDSYQDEPAPDSPLTERSSFSRSHAGDASLPKGHTMTEPLFFPALILKVKQEDWVHAAVNLDSATVEIVLNGVSSGRVPKWVSGYWGHRADGEELHEARFHAKLPNDLLEDSLETISLLPDILRMRQERTRRMARDRADEEELLIRSLLRLEIIGTRLLDDTAFSKLKGSLHVGPLVTPVKDRPQIDFFDFRAGRNFRHSSGYWTSGATLPHDGLLRQRCMFDSDYESLDLATGRCVSKIPSVPIRGRPRPVDVENRDPNVSNILPLFLRTFYQTSHSNFDGLVNDQKEEEGR